MKREGRLALPRKRRFYVVEARNDDEYLFNVKRENGNNFKQTPLLCVQEGIKSKWECRRATSFA